jgi:hypothetical protein
MHKLRYKGSLIKDEVHIDVDRSNVPSHIMKNVFGDHIPDDRIIRIQFYIYKKAPSFIKIVGDNKLLRYSFTYNIVLEADPETRGVIGYSLQFYNNDTTDSYDSIYTVDVQDSCYPKKTLIKHFLSCLINDKKYE